MIIGGNNRKRVEQIIGKLDLGKKDEPEAEGPDDSDLLKGLADEMIRALENKSAADFSGALKSFIQELNSGDEA